MNCSPAESLIVDSGFINPFKILSQDNFSFQPFGTFPIFQELWKISFSVQIDMRERTLFYSFLFGKATRTTDISLNPRCPKSQETSDTRSLFFHTRSHFSGSLPISPSQWSEKQVEIMYLSFQHSAATNAQGSQLLLGSPGRNRKISQTRRMRFASEVTKISQFEQVYFCFLVCFADFFFFLFRPSRLIN